MRTLSKVTAIAKQAALMMQGKDWHKLTEDEELLCKLLEEAEYIIPNDPANGFIGKAAKE